MVHLISTNNIDPSMPVSGYRYEYMTIQIAKSPNFNKYLSTAANTLR